jgi:tetratricopeptide (TPR) repeat protein
MIPASKKRVSMRFTSLLIAALVVSTLAGCSKNAAQYYESGNTYYAQQKYREAIVEYLNAIKKDPKFADARLKLAGAYEKVGDARNAYEHYVRAADLLPDNLDAQMKAGAYLFVTGQFQDAASRADAVLKKNPRHVEALILKGDAAAMLQDLDGAMKQIEEAIQIDPGHSRAYTDLGVIQRQKGNLPAAEQAFRQAVEIDPKSVAAQLALANFYLQSGRQAETEAALKAAYAIDAKDLLSNRALAMFYITTNRAPEAEPYLKTLVETTKDVRWSLALADYYAGTNRAPEATALLEKLAATKEAYGPAKTRIATLQYSHGRQPDAHKTVDEVIAKEPKNDAALLVKARFLVQEKRIDEALARAQAAVAANPRSAEGHYLLGSLYADKNDTERAIGEFNEVLKLNPRASAAQLQVARLELAKGRAGAAGAVQYAEQALTSAPGNPLARLLLVRSLMLKGDLPRADGELKGLLQQYPNAAPVHASAGAMALAKRDFAGARKSFERALQLDAASMEAVAGLVSVDLAAGKAADARRRVEERLAAAPNDPTVLVLAARTYATTGDGARAEQALLKTIEVAPGNLQAYSLLGQLYIQQRKLDQARQKFEEMAQRQPKPVGAHTMVAMILQMQGKNAEAQKRYEKVLEIDRTAPVAANNLAWMYAEGAGNIDVALQLAQAAKAALPDSPEVNDTLGWIYVKKGMPGLALAPLQQAADKDPKNPTYFYHLGTAYAKAEDKMRAKTSLETALRLSPNFPGADEARKTLESLK